MEQAEVKPVTFIEGLVYLGLVERVELLECEPGFSRVVVKTRDGRLYATRCLHAQAARKLASVWMIYVSQKWGLRSEEANSLNTPR